MLLVKAYSDINMGASGASQFGASALLVRGYGRISAEIEVNFRLVSLARAWSPGLVCRKPLEGPERVFPHDGVRVTGEPLQCGSPGRLLQVAQGHGDVAQEALPFGPLDGASAEALAEGRLIQPSERLERW